MVLFPIAVLWLVFVLVWVLRKSASPDSPPRKEWTRPRRRPPRGPHGRPARGGLGARAKAQRRERAARS
jgi:hypothetical protein